MGRLRVWIWASAAAVACACLLAGCGGQGGAQQGAAFSLTVLKESMLAGGQATGFRLTEAPTTTGMAVNVYVQGAEGLKALCYELRYDASRWHPVSAAQTGLLGQADKASGPPAVAELAVLDKPGVVYHGQVLIHPQDQAGFTGDGVLARVTFEPGALRTARNPSMWSPVQVFYGSTVYILRPTGEISWGYSFPGDYNQDGIVSLSDMVPLAVRFGARNPGGKAWLEHAIDGVVNGDMNGEVNLGDLAPLGQNFGRRLTEFRIYGTEHYELDYPNADDSKPDVKPVVRVSPSTMQGNPVTERTYFRAIVPQVSLTAFYWVRPVIDGAVGLPSGVASRGAFIGQSWEPASPVPQFYDPHYGLAYDPVAKEVSFYPTFRGDTDRNGGVNYGDLTPIGVNLYAQGPFPRDSRLWDIDASRDGRIDDLDIAYISLNFGARVGGYHLYAATSGADVPEHPWAQSKIAPLADFELTGDPFAPEPWVYTYDAAPGTYFWVRPYCWLSSDPTQYDESPISEVIQVPAS